MEMENLISFFEKEERRTKLEKNTISVWFNKKNNNYAVTFSDEKLSVFKYARIGILGENLVIVFYSQKPSDNYFTISNTGSKKTTCVIHGKSFVSPIFKKFGKDFKSEKERILIEFESITESIIVLKNQK